MKAQIFIDASEALKAGFDNQGKYVIEFNPSDLSDKQRQHVASQSFSSGSEVFILQASVGTAGVVAPDLENLKRVIDAQIESKKKQAALIKQQDEEREQENIRRIKEWMKLTEAYKLTERFRGQFKTNYPYVAAKTIDAYFELIPGLKDFVADIESLVFWRNLETDLDEMITEMITEKQKIADQAIKKAEQKAYKEAKAKQIAAWVKDHGNESQKERLAAGLLPESEIVDAIREQAYKPLESFNRYQKMNKSDVCICEDWDHEYCVVEFDVNPKEEATESEFEILKQIKSAMPNATVTLRDHTGYADKCERLEHKTSFKVDMTVGVFKFSRLYE